MMIRGRQILRIVCWLFFPLFWLAPPAGVGYGLYAYYQNISYRNYDTNYQKISVETSNLFITSKFEVYSYPFDDAALKQIFGDGLVSPFYVSNDNYYVLQNSRGGILFYHVDNIKNVPKLTTLFSANDKRFSIYDAKPVYSAGVDQPFTSIMTTSHVAFPGYVMVSIICGILALCWLSVLPTAFNFLQESLQPQVNTPPLELCTVEIPKNVDNV